MILLGLLAGVVLGTLLGGMVLLLTVAGAYAVWRDIREIVRA